MLEVFGPDPGEGCGVAAAGEEVFQRVDQTVMPVGVAQTLQQPVDSADMALAAEEVAGDGCGGSVGVALQRDIDAVGFGLVDVRHD